MPLHETVYHKGPRDADIAIVGEAPGYEEAARGIPFVGKSGQENDRLLRLVGIRPAGCYVTNVNKTYHLDNPDPTPEEIEYWTPYLIKEMATVCPALILAVGRFAAEWFLGEIPFKFPLRSIQGVPHRAGCFDSSRADRSQGAPIIPIIHPAAGLRNSRDRVLVAWGYEQAGKAYSKIQFNRIAHGVDWLDGDYPTDEIGDGATYHDVTGTQLAHIVDHASDYGIDKAISMDTEGSEKLPWSIQVSGRPGEGYVLRTSQPDYLVGIDALIRLDCTYRPLWVIHYALHDIPVSRALGPPIDYSHDDPYHPLQRARAIGLELRESRIVDSMYLAYLLRHEPQGLKALAWRWCGMRMSSYMDVVGDSARQRQVDYLEQVAARKWTKLSKLAHRTNAGRIIEWAPQPMEKKAAGILRDLDKRNKDGELTDPHARWFNEDGEEYKREAVARLRAEVEGELGRMPTSTLEDVWKKDPKQAIDYAGRDADATLRVYYKMTAEVDRRRLRRTLDQSMRVVPFAEEIQSVGMPIHRPYFVNFNKELTETCHRLQDELAAFMPCKSFTSVKKYKTERGIEKAFPGLLANRGSTLIDWMYYNPKPGEKERMAKLLPSESAIAKNGDVIEVFVVEEVYVEDRPYINPKSPDDTRVLLETLGLEGMEETDRGDVSTSKSSIEHLRYTHPPIELLFQEREHRHVRDNFVRVPLARVSKESEYGYIHATVKTTRTESRRFATEDPNLMAIPSRTETGKKVRVGYIAPPDWRLFAADYSQVEFRMLAILSGDPLLREIFVEGRDPHSETAARIFNISLDAVSPEQRTAAKSTGFGMIYGMGPQGLQADLRKKGIHWELDNCESTIEGWFDVYRGVEEWKWREIDKATRAGQVVDMWGMPRPLPALLAKDTDYRAWAEACRHVVSHLVQGGAQGAMQEAMGALYPKILDLRRRGHEVYACHQMHDELIFIYSTKLEETGQLVEEVVVGTMENYHGVESDIRLLVECKHGQSWAEVK